MSGMAEVWRAQEERGLSIRSIDEAITGQNVTPAGPFLLTDLLGLDTVLHVAEHLEESYGPERFYVHQGIKALVADGKLGAKTGGVGAYADGEPNLPGDGEADGEELAELLALKSFVEASLLLEEGVAQVRDIDVGMMAGAGLDPRRGLLPPFMRADVARPRRRAREARGGHGAPRRALRAAHDPAPARGPGPAGDEERAGLLRLPAAGRRRVGAADRGRQARDPRRRGDRLAGQRPDERDRPPGHRGPRARCGRRSRRAGVRALVVASANPLLFSAGADIKAFTQMDEVTGRRAHHRRARAAARARARADPHDRGRQRPRLRRRLRAGHGLRRAPGRAAPRSSASPRSSSGSSPASAAPSACRAWWGRTRRWR